MPATADQITRLRKQRNRAAVGAILLIVVSMTAVLPGFLKRSHQLAAVAREAVALQVNIVAKQQQARTVEAELVQTQSEIRNLLRQAH